MEKDFVIKWRLFIEGDGHQNDIVAGTITSVHNGGGIWQGMIEAFTLSLFELVHGINTNSGLRSHHG